jgi:SAM-dependent methyltransferase
MREEVEMIETLAPSAVSAFEDEHRAMWGRLADSYATGAEALTVGAVPAMLDAVRAREGTALLDVGTGPGTLIGPALARGAVVRAVDLSTAMIDQVRARHPTVDARVANASDLPFADGSFDVVTFPFSLHHMAEPAAALAEANRVLHDRGRIACTVWAADDRLVAFGLAFAALAELPVEVVPPTSAPLDSAEAEDLTELVAAAGFLNVDLRELPIGWDLPNAAPLIELMDRLLALSDHGEEVQQQYAAAVDRAVRAWTADAGTTIVPNPAVLVTGRKAG